MFPHGNVGRIKVNYFWVFFCHSNTCKHHVEIANVSYFNDEFLVVNSLELMFRYEIGLLQYTVLGRFCDLPQTVVVALVLSCHAIVRCLRDW